jgi:glycosyltransferase involved in cell wall biosynthesis
VHVGCRSSIFAKRSSGKSVGFVNFPFANNWDFSTVLLVAAALLRLKIDVLIPTRQREYFLGGLAAWPLRRVKVVARLGIDRPIRPGRNRIAFCALFDGVIVNARKIVDVLSAEEAFETDICRVIPNGIFPPALSNGTRERIKASLGTGAQEFLIGAAGRLSPQKGFDMALEAFARLAAKAPLARLVIVGDGPDHAALKRLSATRGIADKVTFTGFRDDVPDILQGIDLFWMTSRSEGMPNVLLEAMAAEKTACAFNVAGVPEVISDGSNGIIIPSGDTAVLATRTLELIADPGRRRRMELEARKTMESDFGMERMVAATEEFLMEVMREGGRRTF